MVSILSKISDVVFAHNGRPEIQKNCPRIRLQILIDYRLVGGFQIDMIVNRKYFIIILSCLHKHDYDSSRKRSRMIYNVCILYIQL